MSTIHLHNPNVSEMEAFAADAEWADSPFWMLNTFAFHRGDAARDAGRAYAERMPEILAGVGARLVMQAPVARTFIGTRTWQAAAIVEYPSPQAFWEMAASPELAAASPFRVAAFRDQFLIPISPGWLPRFDADKPVRAREEIRQWSTDDVEGIESAFVGEHPAQATPTQAQEFVADEAFSEDSVWMLNLLRYAPGGGKDKHDAYVEGGGNSFPGGSLGRQYGLRVVYSARRTYRTLIGSPSWDSAAIVSYPDRDHFLTMSANADYIALHEGRKAGLAETYIIAMTPRRIRR